MTVEILKEAYANGEDDAFMWIDIGGHVFCHSEHIHIHIHIFIYA